MEQAVNTFTGGLNLDSHPMVQGTDTLSDALNATYVTMNGNEVVLQNDMGNRRVDNAYLPAGYEPVGIKEYGGIIYVAAYNPITHRSQIGSFPSPERIMGEEYSDNGAEFNLSKFTSSDNYIIKDGIKFLKDDVILIPLTNDTSLHAGDKFTVYSDDVWSWGDLGLLTNFGTHDGNGNHKYSNVPFNSHFTLSLGILNSSNEFSDITPTLQRFDSDGNIIKDFNSDEEKFNTGYFIAPQTGWENQNGEISDRNKKGTNTYAYKLTGPLYLKAELNHIKTFSYSLETSKTISGDNILIDMYVTGVATYNCPDSGGADPYFDSFELFVKESGNYVKKSINSSINNLGRIYDSTTGNYISTIEKYYQLRVPSSDADGVIDYLIAVPLFHANNDFDERNIFISEFSEFGSLAINKIGTNFCELSAWRYKNTVTNNEVTTTLLDFKFDCYNDKNTKFKDLNIKLENITNNSQNTDIDLSQVVNLETEIDSGRKQYLIDWTQFNDSQKVLSRNLYLAKITYKKNDVIQPTIYRFILGTQLFNKCYDEINEEDYTPDFGIFMGEKDGDYYKYVWGIALNNEYQLISVSEKADDLREKYLKLDEKIDLNDFTLTDSQTSPSEEGGNPLISKTQPSSVNYAYKTFPKTIDIQYQKNWKLSNEFLYPEMTFVGTDAEVEISSITKEIVDMQNKLNYSSNFSQQAQIFDGEQSQSDNEKIITIPTPNSTTIDSSVANHLKFNIVLRDKIYFSHEPTTRLIGKAYVNVNSSVDEYKNAVIELLSRNQSYNGIKVSLNTNNREQGGYEAWFNGTQLYNSGRYYYGWDFYDGTHYQTLFQNYQDYDGEGYSQLEDLYNSLLNVFKTETKCPFTFMLFNDDGENTGFFFDNTNFFSTSSQDDAFLVCANGALEGRPTGSKYTRVWWIDEDGNPTILNNNNIQHKGLFFCGNNTEGNIAKRNEIYKDILQYIGYAKDLILQTSFGNTYTNHELVMPLENYYFEAYYPNPSSYLYAEDLEVNLIVNVGYTLKVTDPSISTFQYNGESCLHFYTNITRKEMPPKIINKKYKIDNTFSQSIFDLSQQTDLTNFSIDLETSKIISKNDPLKRLYVRCNQNKLKPVPSDFPIQINQGTKYSFPLVCKKIYDGNKNTSVNNAIMATICYRTPYHLGWFYITNAVRSLIHLIPSTQQIPVLQEEDFKISSSFFNT